MATALAPDADFQKGLGTETAPNFRDLAAHDSKPVPAFLTEESSPDLGAVHIPAERYTSVDIHRREVDEVWKKTWQVACREEEIPEVGDHFVYNVASLSFLIVRTDVDAFKAYWNVCMHRGRQLVDGSGKGACQFKCGYHAWVWNLDGGLKYFPGKWDFPDVSGTSHDLREVKIDRWGGFLFINPDPQAGPLADHLGKMPNTSRSGRWKTGSPCGICASASGPTGRWPSRRSLKPIIWRRLTRRRCLQWPSTPPSTTSMTKGRRSIHGR